MIELKNLKSKTTKSRIILSIIHKCLFLPKHNIHYKVNKPYITEHQ